jgi:hypothetical protein
LHIPHRIADILREGRAPSLIRHKGAQGRLPVLLEEKIEILVILCQDTDKTIRDTARDTINSWNVAELQEVLASPKTPVEILQFAAHELIPERVELAPALLDNPALPAVLREALSLGAAPVENALATEGTTILPEDGIASETDRARETLLQKISRMTVAEKIRAALMGSQEERTILVRDSNKIVARAVLQSPKLSDQETENVAMMKSVTEEVLRLIATNRKFVRSYGVVRNLMNNPRSPIDVGLTLINRLNERDLKELSRNKNVAEVLRSMAAKMVRQKEAANKPKVPGKH